MTNTERRMALSVARFLLNATTERDIRSAHEPNAVLPMPRLPAHLDDLYTELIAAMEDEGDRVPALLRRS